MLYVRGSPVDEIAAAVGLSAGTVTSYLERARVKFQNAGRSASDREQLRARLAEDGYIEN